MRIGIDLGGTKIEGVAMEAGEIVVRQRVPTPRGDYAATVASVVDLVHGLERQAAQGATVGIGIPGSISAVTGLVKNANSVWLNGRPFRLDLEQALGHPVHVSNDANCFILSEATDGAAQSASVAFGVIIGTGTGGGIVVDGRIVHGRHGIAGEWGHNPLPWPERDEWPGPACYCGRTGCIETFLSGPGLSRTYAADGGTDVAAIEVVQRAAGGEETALRALAAYESRLGRALAAIINVLDPDVIVLGGGLSNIERLYRNVPPLLAPFVFSDRVETALVRAIHGDSSGVRGAAWLG
jgi:fructokinase